MNGGIMEMPMMMLCMVVAALLVLVITITLIVQAVLQAKILHELKRLSDEQPALGHQ